MRAASFTVAGFLLTASACARERPLDAPPADFVVTTADSAYWVTSDPQGLRVRGVPMLLARFGGRFHEVYVTDDDRSFYDAVFVGQRLFVRDIERGDSVQVAADSIVPRLARQYAATHPDDEPLGPDESASDQPRRTATADLEVVDVHGSLISYEYRTDVDFDAEVDGGRGGRDAHSARRGVVDVRDGSQASVASLFGEAAAESAIVAAAREWDSARDSLRSRADSRDDSSGLLTLRTLPFFAFDAKSFSITAIEREPYVAFAVPGTDLRFTVHPIELAPQPVPAPSWWLEQRDELPTGPDTLLRWARGQMEVEARLDSAGEHARLLMRDASRREWSLGVITAPVKRVLWLDATVSPAARRALHRAFNEAAAYSDETRFAAGSRRPSGAKAAAVATLARMRGLRPTPRPRPAARPHQHRGSHTAA